MKVSRTVLFSIFVMLIMASFSQCSSSKKVQEQVPLEIEQVYFQKWIAGVKGGGSGLNIYVPVKAIRPILDSIYFRGKVVKLEVEENGRLYVGRFKTELNQKRDMVMSSEQNAEYGNRVPEEPKKIPFILNDKECVISYQKDGEIRYFKIDDIVEKELIAYPSAPPDKQ